MVDLLPPNATTEEKAIASALSRLSDVPVPIRELWNPDSCPEDLLPWLAWALSVDVWDTNWSEAKKRQVIKAAIEVHRHKGTPYAVEAAFRAVNIAATVTEWFEFGGDPYRFRLSVEVMDEGLDDRAYAIIHEIANKTKNVRSHLDRLDVYLSVSGEMMMGGGLQRGQIVDLYPYETPDLDATGALAVGGAVMTYRTVNLLGAAGADL